MWLLFKVFLVAWFLAWFGKLVAFFKFRPLATLIRVSWIAYAVRESRVKTSWNTRSDFRSQWRHEQILEYPYNPTQCYILESKDILDYIQVIYKTFLQKNLQTRFIKIFIDLYFIGYWGGPCHNKFAAFIHVQSDNDTSNWKAGNIDVRWSPR